MSNTAVASCCNLHEHTAKDQPKTPPARRVIGVDELSIKKGHTYRLVISDLERGRPIWVVGQGVTELDLNSFFLD